MKVILNYAFQCHSRRGVHRIVFNKKVLQDFRRIDGSLVAGTVRLPGAEERFREYSVGESHHCHGAGESLS